MFASRVDGIVVVESAVEKVGPQVLLNSSTVDTSRFCIASSTTCFTMCGSVSSLIGASGFLIFSASIIFLAGVFNSSRSGSVMFDFSDVVSVSVSGLSCCISWPVSSDAASSICCGVTCACGMLSTVNIDSAAIGSVAYFVAFVIVVGFMIGCFLS